MRTTLTIDDQLVLALKRIAGRQGTSFKAVVNDALRAGIAVIETSPQQSPYRTEARAFKFLPGIDPLKLGQISDEMEDLAKTGRSE